MTTEIKKIVMLRQVDATTWRGIKLLAVKNDITLAKMIKILFEHYIKTGKKAA